MTTRPSESFLPGVRQVVAKRTTGATDDEPLISAGRIDSMSIVDLILDLEEAFGVRIPPGEVQPSDFDSILAIADTVSRFA